MNIVLLNNHSVLNAGDHAILLETLALLDRGFPGARVTLVFNDLPPAAAAHPDRVVVASPLASVVRLTADRSYEFAGVRARRAAAAALFGGALATRAGRRIPQLAAAHAPLLRSLAEADLVLACGGGYMYAPAAEGPLGWFDFTMLGCLLAALLRKPLVILPQSIGPLHTLRQRLTVALVARHARMAFAREAISHALLREIGAGGRALQAPDLAFGMPAERAAGALPELDTPANNAAFRVGITALNWAGQNFTFTAQEQYERAMLALVDAIGAADGQAVLFAQCCGPSAAEDDRIVARRLFAAARRPERVALVDRPLSPHQLQAAYGRMDAFVGTRMHSVILALNAGVPALAVGYLHKTRGMLAQAGLPDSGLEIGALEGHQLVAALERLRAAPEQPQLQPYLARARRFKHALPGLLRAAGRL